MITEKSDNFSLTLEEAKKALHNGKIISHSTFVSGEYIRMDNGKLIDEQGTILDELYFFQIRAERFIFQNGWFVLE